MEDITQKSGRQLYEEWAQQMQYPINDDTWAAYEAGWIQCGVMGAVMGCSDPACQEARDVILREPLASSH